MTAFTLPWTQALALQANDLNASHRGLLDKLNALLIAIPSKDQTRVLMAFSALTAEAQAHFAVEEEQMREAGYPDLAKHREHHQRLLQGLAELRFTVSAAQNFKDTEGPFVFLERWFVPHLTHDDKKLADFLAARTPPSPTVAVG
jgi:hemerythrin